MKAGTTELLKFIKLQRRLNESRRGVIGLLEGLWLATAKNCPTGDIGKFTDEEISIMVDWEGEPDFLVESLVDCGWIDRCKTHRLVVHDWADHCPQYVKGNLKKYGREIISQPAKEAPKDAPKEVPKETPNEHPMEGATKPSLFKPNQAKPIQEDSSVVSEPTTDPPILIFPCNGNPKEWGLTQAQISEWNEIYSGIDILAECKKALAWIRANRRKTAKGMPKFLVGWLNKAVDGQRLRVAEPQKVSRLPTMEERAQWRP
jgi:hypothetical protein